MKSLILIFVLAFSFSALAEDSNTLSERASKRLYPGGSDESEVAVQTDMPTPYKTVNVRAVQKSVYDKILKEASDVGEPGSESSSN